MKTTVINPGLADQMRFERHADIGFMLVAPNGTQLFLTDDMLDQLVDFQRDSYIAELQVKVAIQESHNNA
jgi:hypothetical protein